MRCGDRCKSKHIVLDELQVSDHGCICDLSTYGQDTNK